MLLAEEKLTASGQQLRIGGRLAALLTFYRDHTAPDMCFYSSHKKF